MLCVVATAQGDVPAISSTGPYVLDSALPPPSGNAWFGWSNAMWHDDVSGTQFAVVGAPAENAFGGAAYVFSRTAGDSNWHQEARLTAADGSPLDEFGYAVAIDGDTVAIGAPLHVGDFFVGAAYMFVRDEAAGTWTQQGDEIAATDIAFGTAVALRGDMLAVADSASNVVFTYARSSSTWSPFERLFAPADFSGEGFGSSLAMTDTHLLIGAAHDDAVATGQGSAALYSRSREGWDLQQVLRPEIDTSAHQWFGYAVALSDEAIVVGAPTQNPKSGTAHTFVYDDASAKWIEQSLLRNTGGTSVALSAGLLAIGGSGIDTATVYHNEGGAWVRDSVLSGESASLFGSSVAVAGGEVVVGAPASGDTQQGAANVFVNDRIFADGFD